MTDEDKISEITKWLDDCLDNSVTISADTLHRFREELRSGSPSGEAWLLLGMLAKYVKNDFDVEFMRECFERASQDPEYREDALEELGYAEYVYGDAPVVAIGYFEEAKSQGFRLDAAIGIAKCCIELKWCYTFRCIVAELCGRQYVSEAKELQEEMLLEHPDYDKRLLE